MHLPTYDQVLGIPAFTRRTVPDEFIDENGHMNIGRYMELAATSLWSRCISELGMPEDYIASRGMSTFTAEHHLTYVSEVLEGEEVSTHIRLLERSPKVLHTVVLVVNRGQQRLACVVEATLIHMDMTARRPTPFPDDVAALVDAAIEDDRRDWPAPVCGAMGVTRRA